MVLNYSLAPVCVFILFDLKWHYKIFCCAKLKFKKHKVVNNDLYVLLVNTLENFVKFELAVFMICVLFLMLQVYFANEIMVLF